MSANDLLSARFSGLSRVTLNGSLGASLVALLIVAIVVISGLIAIVTAAFSPGVGKVRPDQQLNELIAEHDKHLQTWQDRLNGRSPFFKPPAPAPPQPDKPVVHEVIRPPEPIKDPGPPTSYPGPPIAFAYGDTVYFSPMTAGEHTKYLRVRVGEEQSGIRVLSISLPWTVKVGMKGGEYDVPLFNRSDQSAFVKGQGQPVILQDSFISAVIPPPEITVPPPTGTLSEPTINQAAAMSGEQGVQPPRRSQPARAVPQPRGRQQPPQAPQPQSPRGAPPENAPPQPAEEQPIEESGVEEPAADDEPVEDPEAQEQGGTQPPANAPGATLQGPQSRNADTSGQQTEDTPSK